MGNEPRRYRMEIGINLQAATLPRTNPNMRLYPLQYGLVDVTDPKKEAPAWVTRLRAGDKLTFHLVDTTALTREHDTEGLLPSVALVEFIFTQPNSGRPEEPFTDTVISWEIGGEMPEASPVYSHPPDTLLPTRVISAMTSEGSKEWLTLKGFRSENQPPLRLVELAVVLKLDRGGWTDQFIFDPEMIISDIDN